MLEEHLLKLVRSGDDAAALELYRRYNDLVTRQSSRFGRHTTFDIEDARQTAFISMLTAVAEHEDLPTPEDFTKIFYARIIADLKDEAARQRFQTVIPLRTFRHVFETVQRFNFNFGEARDYLAGLPRHRSIAKETFDSVWFWAFGTQVEWSSPAPGTGLTADESTVDYGATEAFNAIEDRDAVESLLTMLTDAEREVIERWYGLAEFEPQVSEVIGTAMGMNAASIRRIHSRVLAKLQINSDLPDHWR